MYYPSLSHLVGKNHIKSMGSVWYSGNSPQSGVGMLFIQGMNFSFRKILEVAFHQ